MANGDHARFKYWVNLVRVGIEELDCTLPFWQVTSLCLLFELKHFKKQAPANPATIASQ